MVKPFFTSHPTGGKRVSFSLLNVQLLDNAEPLGRMDIRAEDAFSSVEIEGAAPGSAEDLWAGLNT
jgi:hypothetical protein